MSSGTAAVLFDIDGTLVDSNYLHIHAWCRAFAEVGVGVESWRIHRSIGMDGSELVKSLAAEAGENAQKSTSELHSRYYTATAPLLRVVPSARELLTRVAALGLQVVLATSAPEDELSILRAFIRRRGHRLDGYVVRRCRDRQTRARHRRDRSPRSGRVGVARRVRRRFSVGRESQCARRSACRRGPQRWNLAGGVGKRGSQCRPRQRR